MGDEWPPAWFGAIKERKHMYLIDDVMNELAEVHRKLDLLLEMRGRTPQGAYILTEEEAAEVIVVSERPTQNAHLTEPAMGLPVFGPDMREVLTPDDGGFVDGAVDYPLLATCVCGRQICKVAAGTAWVYSGT